MTFTITWEDESRTVLELLSNELVLGANVSLGNFRLLRYLDPYGDTVFNRNQLADLLTDLQQLAEVVESPVISQLISLARKCQDKVHTYLCFYGD